MVQDPAAVRGVVLFLHGFSQSPKAYALLYEALVADNLLVVAPDPQPMFSLSTKVLQVGAGCLWCQRSSARCSIRTLSWLACDPMGLGLLAGCLADWPGYMT